MRFWLPALVLESGLLRPAMTRLFAAGRRTPVASLVVAVSTLTSLVGKSVVEMSSVSSAGSRSKLVGIVGVNCVAGTLVSVVLLIAPTASPII